MFQGSFLKALEKFQQELSYEEDVYDIYQDTRTNLR